MTESTEYFLRMDAARKKRVLEAARSTRYGRVKSLITTVNKQEYDTNGKIHKRRFKLSANVLSGKISWTQWLPVTLYDMIARRPTVKSTVTAGSNIKIHCKVMNRSLVLNWIHGKPLWFKCVKGIGEITDTEYVSTLFLNSVHYGQTTVSTPADAPMFVLKHGIKGGRKSINGLEMMRFCIGHEDYKAFRSHVRREAWAIMNGEAKVDLTILRLAVDFIDFVKHPRVAALFDIDKANKLIEIKKGR